MANGQAEQMVDLNSRKSYKDAARIIEIVNINLQQFIEHINDGIILSVLWRSWNFYCFQGNK